MAIISKLCGGWKSSISEDKLDWTHAVPWEYLLNTTYLDIADSEMAEVRILSTDIHLCTKEATSKGLWATFEFKEAISFSSMA